jgi:SAM-dependent methyltransferase
MNPEEQKRVVRQGYDSLSYAYRGDDTQEDHGDYAAWIHELAVRLPEQSPVLDIGCGCGLPATRILARRFVVTGVDFSEVQIARAKQLVPAARFLCEDVSAITVSPGLYSAVVSFYAIIHMPLAEQAELFKKIAEWLKPGGYFLGTVGHDAWTGTEEAYLGVPGGKMCWSHADEATNVRWLQEAGLHVHWTRFVPEGTSGHTLVFAQKPPIEDTSTMRCRSSSDCAQL